MSDAQDVPPVIPAAQPRRIQFSIQSLLRWQLLLLPVLLSSLYFTYGGPPPGAPLVRLAAMIVAPLCYVVLLVLWPIWSPREERVATTIQRGATYGALFALLAMLPHLAFSALVIADQAIDSPGTFVNSLPGTLERLGMAALILLFLAFFNSVLGAAAGGVIGLIKSAFRPAWPGPSPQP